MLSFNYSNIDKRTKRNFSHSQKQHKVFLEGPPFISGKKEHKYSGLHMGHALVSYIKSTLMNYYDCKPWTGSDNHGLPTEMLVMDMLNLKTPQDIENYGIVNFNDKCKRVISEYENKWDPVYDMIGREYDMNYRYKTCSFEYMKCVWKVFKKLYENNHIYSGVKILPFDISAKCCLSNFEANQEYKTINTNSLFVKFKLVNEEKYFIAWTTTAWTLPGNCGLCVNKNAQYVLINDSFIIGKNFIDNVKDVIDIKDVKDININDYIGKEYIGVNDNCKIVCDDYVESSGNGTGIVHLSPFFGEDDYRVCVENNLIDKEKLLDEIIIDDEGNYCKTKYKGNNIFDKNLEKQIIKDFDVIKQQQISHQYPFSPRTHKPLIYKACHSYFIRVENIREQLVENIKKTKWNNESAKNRMIKFVENARDWCISRNRYFGTPIPIWTCASNASNGNDEITFDDTFFIEQPEHINDMYGFYNDIHPEFMTDIVVNGKTYKWCSEILDCWAESGCAGIFNLGFEQTQDEFISDFVVEGIDQCRGWFYTLLIISYLYNKSIPYKNVICTGLVMDKNGKKFSKSSGNYIAPEEMIMKYGSDSCRLYLLGSCACDGGNLVFDENGIKEAKSKLIQYYNSIIYFVEYYNYFNKQLKDVKTDNIFDIWILEKIKNLKKKIFNNLDNYIVRDNINMIYDFIEDFTNYYIKFNRNRINGCSGSEEQMKSLCVVINVIKSFNDVLKIFCPFSSDEIEETIGNINCCVDYDVIDKPFETFKNIIVSIRKARSMSKKFSSVKKCINDIIVNLYEDIDISDFINYIKEESNCCELIIKRSEGEYEYDVKVDFDNIDRNERKKYIEMLKNERENIIKENRKGFVILKKVKFNQEKGRFKIFDNEMLIDISLEENEKTKKMNELRELINVIQMKRKEMGLHVYDKIVIHINEIFKEHCELLENKLKAKVIFDCCDLFIIDI